MRLGLDLLPDTFVGVACMLSIESAVRLVSVFTSDLVFGRLTGDFCDERWLKSAA